MAAISECLQIEPGEIVPFCKSDELEPGEIRPRYLPLQLQTSAQANVFCGGRLLVPMQTCWGNRIQTQAGVSVKNHGSSQNSQQAVVKQKDNKIKPLQEVPIEWKNTLEKERKAFAVKCKQQSRKIRDLEIKDQFQQNEIKKQTNAAAVAENMWKKTNEEKEALNAMMLSMEKEGCKMNRLLKTKEASLSNAESKIAMLESDFMVLKKEKLEADDKIADLKAECERVAHYKSAHKKAATKNTQKINELEDQVAYYKNAHEKAAKKLTKASQAKESLSQQSDLWRSKLTKIEQEKEATDTEKATLSKKIKSLKIKCFRRGKIIETEKEAHVELQKEIKNLKDGLKKLKKERDLLIQENNFLKEENHNLRYYGGVTGSIRRLKRFFGRLADRLLS